MTAERRPARVSMPGAVAEGLETTARWELRLYVAGRTSRSLAAIANPRRICETHLQGQYRIEVVDLRAHPELAGAGRMVALATRVRKRRSPTKRIIGDISGERRTLGGMEPVQEA
jgi:circadian clock protein KaiB